MAEPNVYRCSVIHSLDVDTLEMLDDAAIVVDQHGCITEFAKSFEDLRPHPISYIHLPKGDFLQPGFIDTHNAC